MLMIIKLFAFFILLMGLPDWYIYQTRIRPLKKAWIKKLYWLPTICFFIAMVFILFTHEPRPHAMNRLSMFLIIFMCVNVPKAIFSILSIFLRFVARKINHEFYESYIALVLAICTFGYILYGGTEGKQHFQIKEVSLSYDNLPKGFDGYQIALIADIHAGSWTGNIPAIKRAVDMVNGCNANLIIFAGDLVNNLATELDEFMPTLSQLKAPDGVYSILGNHDYSPYIQWKTEKDKQANLDALIERQAQMGWKLMLNEHDILVHNGDSIALIGVENTGYPPFPDLGDLPKAMKGTEGMFQILMSHDPTHWRREVLDTDIELMLAGHTHAMQTQIGSFTPAQFVYPENMGLYSENGQDLYVNIGLGHTMFPMRLGAWPEITLITLHCKP